MFFESILMTIYIFKAQGTRLLEQTLIWIHTVEVPMPKKRSRRQLLERNLWNKFSSKTFLVVTTKRFYRYFYKNNYPPFKELSKKISIVWWFIEILIIFIEILMEIIPAEIVHNICMETTSVWKQHIFKKEFFDLRDVLL